MTLGERVGELLDGMQATDAERAAAVLWLLGAGSDDGGMTYVATCIDCGASKRAYDTAWDDPASYNDVRIVTGVWVCSVCWRWERAGWHPGGRRRRDSASAIIQGALRAHVAKLAAHQVDDVDAD